MFEYLAAAAVHRFNDGSLMYATVSSGASCYDVGDGSFELEVEFEIVGGTRRFEGASGSMTCTVTGATLPGVFPFSGECTGVIE